METVWVRQELGVALTLTDPKTRVSPSFCFVFHGLVGSAVERGRNIGWPNECQTGDRLVMGNV